MRELFYRRDNKGGGGYRVVAREASISAKDETFGSQKAVPVSAGEVPMFTYKMCCADTGTLMVSCGYIDPHGSRGSSLTHVLMTEDAAERRALLEAYPASSPYFENIRARYSQDEEPLDLEAKALKVPLADYLDGAQRDPKAGIAILRETFGSEELLRQVFTALLDAASANPRMVVVVLEDDSLEALPEHGRRIAEALFACLPDVVAARVGYQSPALNLSDVTFSLRFVNQVALSKSSVVYSVQPSQKRFAAPSGMRAVVGDYADMLARKVMDDDLGAFVWIRTMARQLSDWSMFGSKNMPQDIALRYAFYTRQDALTPQEIRQLLDWHHGMVEQAVRSGSTDSLDASGFWRDADRWIATAGLSDIWKRQDVWKRGDPVYDPMQIRILFEDAQQLHLLGRPEAGAYRQFFAAHLERGTLCAPADAGKLKSELIKYYCDEAARAQSDDFSWCLLYWSDIEAWIRGQWRDGSLMRESRVCDAVRKLYRHTPDAMQPYVDAYVDYIADRKPSLCTGDDSEFYRDVVQRLFDRRRDTFAACMQQELKGQNPFQSAQAMQKYRWYQDWIKDDSRMAESLRRLSDSQLDSALNSLNATDAELLLEELNGGRGKGYLAIAEQLSSRADAAVRLEQQIVSLLRNSGFYDYYPEKRQTARQIADILDQSHAYTGVSWTQRYDSLEKVVKLPVGKLTGDDFDAYLSESTRVLDNRLRQKAKSLLWAAIRNAYEGEKQPDYASLLRALTMKSYESGSFSPSEICRDFEKLNLSEARFKRFCAKQANEKADEGLGYLASEVLRYLKLPAKRRGEIEKRYPREARRYDAPARRAAPPFSGVPIGVPLVGTLLFGGGLAASGVMLLRLVGLM